MPTRHDNGHNDNCRTSRQPLSAPNSPTRQNTRSPAGTGSTTALTWLGPLTNGQLLIGSTGGYPIPATLVGANGIGISNTAGGIVISGSGSTITFIEDSGSATSASGFLYLYGSAFQGQGTTASGNTITFFNLDWTTTQKGVGILSTNADTTTGTTTTAAVTPACLRAKLGDQTKYLIAAGTGSTTALTWLGPADKWPASHRQHRRLSSCCHFDGRPKYYYHPIGGRNHDQRARLRQSDFNIYRRLWFGGIVWRIYQSLRLGIPGAGHDCQRQYDHFLQPRLDDNAKGRGDSVDKSPTRQQARPQLPPSRQPLFAPNSATDKIPDCRRRQLHNSTDLAGSVDERPAPHRQHQCVSGSRNTLRDERHWHQPQRGRNCHFRKRPCRYLYRR